MSVGLQYAHQTKDVVQGRRSARGWAAARSWFVLLALAGFAYHVSDAELKMRFRFDAEAAFTTVQAIGPRNSPGDKPNAVHKLVAGVTYMRCQCYKTA